MRGKDKETEATRSQSMLSEVHNYQRVFTLEEATRTLPLVRRILRDIVDAHKEIESLRDRRRAHEGAEARDRDPEEDTGFPEAIPAEGRPSVEGGEAAKGTVEPGTVEPGTVEPGTEEPGTVEKGTVEKGTVEKGTVEERMQLRVNEIEGFLQELEAVGCECKDFSSGLVDFPAFLAGRVVYLCWKLGEPEIAHWHEVDAGFSGRQLVSGVFP